MLRLVSLLVLVLCACSTYRSDLYRGQRYYEENEYEAALALWRVLEPDQGALTPNERVRYAYFRGMTAYRLGYRADARYWLSLARAGEQLAPASLTDEYKQRLGSTLEDLNADRAADAGGAIGDGTESLLVEPTSDDPAGAPCEWSTDCPRGYICQDRVCIEL